MQMWNRKRTKIHIRIVEAQTVSIFLIELFRFLCFLRRFTISKERGGGKEGERWKKQVWHESQWSSIAPQVYLHLPWNSLLPRRVLPLENSMVLCFVTIGVRQSIPNPFDALQFRTSSDDFCSQITFKTSTSLTRWSHVRFLKTFHSLTQQKSSKYSKYIAVKIT